ncbi:alpha-L-fucosidase [Jiangella asiatica]|nr:alpha-L-fucosidase [Jiangella asiatica]
MAVLAGSFLSASASAQGTGGADPGQVSPGEAYQALGFGVFMHYGLATFVGQTPWSYDPRDYPATTYAPEDFDPDQWMDAIVAAGAKYIILTTKHHDGFAMWDSAYTEYDVANSSDPETDVVGEVVSAARERGLEVAFYYSWWDKMEPGGNVLSGAPPSPEYVEFAKNQMRELLTEYGPVVGLWLDIPTGADLNDLADFIHGVSPETAFIPNLREVSDAEDVTSFEGPGIEMMPCDYTGLPAEQAYNVAGGPGWWEMTADAQPSGDVDEAVSTLAYVRYLGATLSLNVSPGPTGQFSPANVRLLEGIGDRLRGGDLLAGATTTAGSAADGHPAGDATDLEAKTYWAVPADGESAWLRVDLPEVMTIDQTAVQFTSDDVAGYRIEYRAADGSWRTAREAGTPSIPTQHDQFTGVTTDSLRLVVDGASDGVGVAEFKAYGGIDDTADTVEYDGSWQAMDRPATAPEVPRLPPSVPFAGAFNQSVHRSREAGDTATFTFTGNAVELRASVGPDQGIATVGIDGAEPQAVDLYRAEAGRNQTVFEQDALEPGPHTLTVEVTGERNAASTGSWVTLDGLIPLAALAPFTPGAPFEVLPDGRRIYDDTGDRCTANSPIEYSGPWQHGAWNGAWNATRHFAYQPATAELAFEGTGVAVMVQTRPGHGIAAISVDGGEEELVDTYSDPAQEQVVVWERDGLEPGPHTVTLRVTGTNDPPATNTWVGLDAIIVTP